MAVAGERLFDGLGIEDGDRRLAMRAGMVAPDIDRCAAAGTAHVADFRRQAVDLGCGQLAHEALFDHELGEGREPSMLLQATVIVEAPAGVGDVEAVQQPVAAARAGERVAQWQPRGIAVLVDQFEQGDDPARGDLATLELVKPDAVARKAQVENNFAVVLAFETVLGHGLAAGGAG